MDISTSLRELVSPDMKAYSTLLDHLACSFYEAHLSSDKCPISYKENQLQNSRYNLIELTSRWLFTAYICAEHGNARSTARQQGRKLPGGS